MARLCQFHDREQAVLWPDLAIGCTDKKGNNGEKKKVMWERSWPKSWTSLQAEFKTSHMGNAVSEEDMRIWFLSCAILLLNRRCLSGPLSRHHLVDSHFVCLPLLPAPTPLKVTTFSFVWHLLFVYISHDFDIDVAYRDWWALGHPCQLICIEFLLYSKFCSVKHKKIYLNLALSRLS